MRQVCFYATLTLLNSNFLLKLKIGKLNAITLKCENQLN